MRPVPALLAVLVVAACGPPAGDAPGENPAEAPSESLAPESPSGAKEAPATVFETLDGDEASLADLGGSVAIVNFWGTWCLPCRGELPELAALAREYDEGDVRVVGIAVDSGTPDDIRAFLEPFGVRYEIWMTDMSTALGAFGTVGYPFTLVLDREGLIRKEYVGPQTAETLGREIEALLP